MSFHFQLLTCLQIHSVMINAVMMEYVFFNIRHMIKALQWQNKRQMKSKMVGGVQFWGQITHEKLNTKNNP